MSRKTLLIGMVAGGAALTLAADVSVVFGAYWRYYPVTWWLILLTGAVMIVPTWKFLWVGDGAFVISLLHCVILFVACAFDTRTFYGGAMVPVVAMYCWVLVTGVLALTVLLRYFTRGSSTIKRLPPN